MDLLVETQQRDAAGGRATVVRRHEGYIVVNATVRVKG
jgi:hypothetical protein